MVAHEFEEDSAWATSESGSLDSHRWDGKCLYVITNKWVNAIISLSDTETMIKM